MKTLILILIVIVAGCAQQPSQTETEIPYNESSDEAVTQSSDDYHQTGDEQRYAQSPLWTDMSKCEERKVVFTFPPIDIDLIDAIEPQGELTGHYSGHITPGDHMGIRYNPNSLPIEVRAMADGYIVRVERQRNVESSPFPSTDNYHVYFEYSCKVFGDYIHLTEFSPNILSQDTKLKDLSEKRLTQMESVWPRIPVKAGQVIGKVQSWGLLGLLTVDTDITLNGFVNPSLYDAEPWKTHSVSFLDYYNESLRSRLAAKNPRKAEPVGGKIDIDVTGRLAGSWFLEGTDYGGGSKAEKVCDRVYCPYWEGHLAFVYDYVTPSEVRITIGFDPKLYPQGPYGVKGNSPDPASITPSNGLVKYELVGLKSLDSENGVPEYPNQMPALVRVHDDSFSAGTLLVQMLDERRIKMDVFAEKTPNQISGFSQNAKVYER